MNFYFLHGHCVRHRSRGRVWIFAQLHTQLLTHKHLTLQLLWENYRETQPNGYGYSRFCETLSAVEPQPGCGAPAQSQSWEKTFVDWAGDTVPVYDRERPRRSPRASGGPAVESESMLRVHGEAEARAVARSKTGASRNCSYHCSAEFERKKGFTRRMLCVRSAARSPSLASTSGCPAVGSARTERRFATRSASNSPSLCADSRPRWKEPRKTSAIPEHGTQVKRSAA